MDGTHANGAESSMILQQQQQQQLNSPPPMNVKLSAIIHRVVEKAYDNFLNVCEGLPEKDENGRKVALLEYLEQTRNQFIRLLVLLKWTKSPSINKFWDLIYFLNRQDAVLRETADRLWGIHHQTLLQAKAPMYDIPNAVDVLVTGNFRIPTCIKDRFTKHDPPTRDSISEFFERLNHLIHFRLITSVIPPQLRILIKEGKAICTVDNEFSVTLTLPNEDQQILWRVLSVEILVSDSNENQLKDAGHSQSGSWTDQLAQQLQQRMAESMEPFNELYSYLHNFCIALQLDILHTQARHLGQTRRADMMKVDFDKERLCLTLYYWRNLEKSLVGNDGKLTFLVQNSLLFYLKINIDANGELAVNHYPPLTMPFSSTPIAFSIDSKCLNIENLLVKVLRCHAYSMLYSLYAILLNSEHSKNDIRLLVDSELKKSILKIRLLENRYLSISIDLRTGHYLMSVRSMGFNEDQLKGKEAELNKDPSKIIAIVTSLRYSMLLSFFEGIAHWLKLETFHSLNWESDENTLKFSGQTLFLHFPNFSSTFFLAVDIDKQFHPKFYLLRTKRIDNSMKLRLEEIYDIAQTHSTNFFGGDQSLKRRLNSDSAFQITKRMKIDEPNNDNLDIEDDEATQAAYREYKWMFISVVDYCRRKMINYITCQRYLSDQNIRFKKVGEEIVFPINTETLEKKIDGFARAKFLDEGWWEVRVRVLQPPIFQFLQFDKPNFDDSIICTEKEWRFCYRKLHAKESIGQFFTDLKVFITLISLARQTENVLFGKDGEGVYAGVRKYFKVSSLKPTRITFSYSGYKTLTIRWKCDKDFVVLPLSFAPKTNPLKRFLEASFRAQSSSNSIFSLLQAIMRSAEPMEKIQEFNQGETGATSSDIGVIPRSASQVRLIYRNSCAVDIRFLMDDMVIIDDASQPIFNAIGANGSTRFTELKRFDDFVSRFILPLNTRVNPQYTVPQTQLGAAKACLVYHSVLGLALHRIYLFMACFVLWRSFFKILEEKEKEGLLKRAAQRRQDQYELSFSITKPSTQEFTIYIKDYSSLEIKQSTNSSSGLRSSSDSIFDMVNSDESASGMSSLSQDEMNEISTFFSKKASGPPYLQQNGSSFVRILTLPTPVRKEMQEVVKLEPEGGAQSFNTVPSFPFKTNPSVFVELCLTMQTQPSPQQLGYLRTELGLPLALSVVQYPQVGDSVFFHKDAANEIYFLARFWLEGQPHKYVNLPLKYKYPSAGLFLWIPSDKPDTTPQAAQLNTTGIGLTAAITLIRDRIAPMLQRL